MNKIIAAVKDNAAFKDACKSKVDIIFDLAFSIEDAKQKILLCHESKKILFVHVDLAEGIGKDKAGLNFMKKLGVDGIISTRASMIKLANEAGLKTVQRIFLLDSQSIESAVAIIKPNPTMLEIMPGVIASRIIKYICNEVDLPIIAGGFIENATDIENAINSGVSAVSTSKKELWDC